MWRPPGINPLTFVFCIYVNGLCNASNILDPKMFADDTNLFLSHQIINTLFKIFNEELNKIGDWFKENKLSLNNRKTKYTIFHKTSSKDNVPLKLPALKIARNIIERKAAIKFLGVILDKNIFWEEHIRTVETKIAKKLDYYTAKRLYSKKNLLKVFILHKFIHT